MIRLSGLLLLAAVGSAPPPDRSAGEAVNGGGPLVVSVTDVRSARGHVRIDVCTKTEFLHDCSFSAAAPAVVGVTRVVVPAVPAGVYAIQAYLDENDNGHVDRNAIGIPKEGVGFSNDAGFFLGPPSWRVARFEIGSDGGTVRLRLRYMRG